jgi:hypothetical protein
MNKHFELRKAMFKKELEEELSIHEKNVAEELVGCEIINDDEFKMLDKTIEELRRFGVNKRNARRRMNLKERIRIKKERIAYLKETNVRLREELEDKIFELEKELNLEVFEIANRITELISNLKEENVNVDRREIKFKKYLHVFDKEIPFRPATRTKSISTFSVIHYDLTPSTTDFTVYEEDGLFVIYEGKEETMIYRPPSPSDGKIDMRYGSTPKTCKRKNSYLELNLVAKEHFDGWTEEQNSRFTSAEVFYYMKRRVKRSAKLKKGPHVQRYVHYNGRVKICYDIKRKNKIEPITNFEIDQRGLIYRSSSPDEALNENSTSRMVELDHGFQVDALTLAIHIHGLSLNKEMNFYSKRVIKLFVHNRNNHLKSNNKSYIGDRVTNLYTIVDGPVDRDKSRILIPADQAFGLLIDRELQYIWSNGIKKIRIRKLHYTILSGDLIQLLNRKKISIVDIDLKIVKSFRKLKRDDKSWYIKIYDKTKLLTVSTKHYRKVHLHLRKLERNIPQYKVRIKTPGRKVEEFVLNKGTYKCPTTGKTITVPRHLWIFKGLEIIRRTVKLSESFMNENFLLIDKEPTYKRRTKERLTQKYINKESVTGEISSNVMMDGKAFTKTKSLVGVKNPSKNAGGTYFSKKLEKEMTIPLHFFLHEDVLINYRELLNGFTKINIIERTRAQL